ncbi:MAG TPA: amino acid adenylation domain-containing protein [Pyrinomonadaceae bacterium]|nr:amino acid adenylation domain-containing protein [Pyrinomonadaceae bacterium]
MRSELLSQATDEVSSGGVAASSLSLVELLRERARHQPEFPAYTFLPDGETEEAALSYRELDRRARVIAARLQRSCPAGERVLLLYPPGLEFIAAFFGCLYAGMVAVPTYPPRANRSNLRLQNIAADAQARVALTVSSTLGRIEPTRRQADGLGSLDWLATDELDEGLAGEWHDPKVDGRTTAFLQYTSGSTGSPKGVVVSHANLLHNERLIQNAFGQTPRSVILSWLPLYHDMGLIGGVLQPLQLGARCILMSPMAFLQRPFRWLSAVSRYRATTSGGPNFAYELCVRKVSEEQADALDLSSWGVAFNGAEPVRARTLEEFAARFGRCGFRREAFHPCYGLAEATLMVSAGRRQSTPVVMKVEAKALESNLVVEASGERDEGLALVGCGLPSPEQKVLIVHPDSLTVCRPEEVGEIWVEGPSVTAGYWNRPSETEQTFRARPAGAGAGTFLRTGDLGFLRDGELFVTGRLKDLIIIRGRNLYPSDIERTVEESHGALRRGGGAAFSVEVDGGEQLVVVQEIERGPSASFGAVAEAVREAVAREHEVSLFALLLVKAGSVPKTSSGKVQRRACRQMFLAGEFEAPAVWREDAPAASEAPPAADHSRGVEGVEGWLRLLLASKLGVEPSRINVAQPITRYGLDSLLALELAHAAESELGVVLEMTSLLQGASIAELAAQAVRQLGGGPRASGPDAGAHDGQASHPLSYGQQALWFLSRMAPDSAAYHVAAAARIRQPVDAEALRRAYEALVERHAALRTTFIAQEGHPRAVVHERAAAGFELADASELDDASLNRLLVEMAHRPFTLDAGPLVRLSLLRTAHDAYVLLLAAHHIVVDFWSLALLVQELGLLYDGERDGRPCALAPLPSEYADYVRTQTRMLDGPEGERLRLYWEGRLSGPLPVLDLPADRPRPPVQTYRGASHAVRLDAGLTRRLKTLGRQSDATLYTTLLAAFQTLLHRYTGQEDVLVGTPTTGRGRAALSPLVGYFVNPVVLRTDLSGDPTFLELLGRVRQTVLDALAHREYPFPLLVQQLQPERDPSRSPLFQAMFVLQQAQTEQGQTASAFALGEAGTEMRSGRLVLESMALEQRVAQFDLSLAVAESGDSLLASFEYNTDLFDATTVARMAGHFRTLLESIVADPARPLSRLPWLPEEERRQLLVEWNSTAVDYSPADNLAALFEAQVRRTPDAVALVFEDERISYGELNARANQLAHHLRRLGAGPETLVGVLMRRTAEMVVALLGILKAGAAYVPLDPDYPQGRLAYMLADADVPVLLTQESLRASVPGQRAQVFCLDTQREMLARQSSADPPPTLSSADGLAYVIYTSGSTGKPKGVAISHRSAVTLLQWARATFSAEELRGVLASTSVCFDLSVFELFAPLGVGGKVILAENALALPTLPAADEVTLVNTVPSAMAELVRMSGLPRSVRCVNLAGEPLKNSLVQQVYAREHVRRVLNLYGPSEDTTYSTFACHERGATGEPTIGRPIANTQIYLLDEHLEPVPVGVAGELHIGGAGLARGYLRRPRLTAEKFIPSPFGERPGERLYKTGDMARYLSDGDIEFLGRLDHQVKVRGFRIEPGEIESAMAEHAAVREAVVVTREAATGDAALVAYVVWDGGVPPPFGELRRFLSARLPEYMIPSAFVSLGALPLSPNGKLDRRALPAPPDVRPESAAPYAAPRNQVEEMLAEIWSAVLGLSRVGIDDNFFELGGHSLLAAQVLARAQKAFQTELPLRLLFEAPTVARFAERLEASLQSDELTTHAPIRAVRRGAAAAPLSFMQQRLWFLEQYEPGGYAYNMPGAVRLSGTLDIAALRRSLDEVVSRHETLRTRFALVDGEPVQVIAPALQLALPVSDLGGWEEGSREARLAEILREEAQRPFNLAEAPLMRARLVRLRETEHALAVTLHHIVSDGWSLDLLLHEMATLYGAFSAGEPSPLPELTIQYADYAHWQRQALQGEALAKRLSYWRKQMGGAPAVLELPADRPRPPARTNRGSKQTAVLTREQTDALKALSRREGVTLFMTLLAAFKVLLYRYTGQPDIVVGTPHSNRHQVETESLIGFFVNMLVLRTDLSGNPTFTELLGRVRETALTACSHDLPFEKLVEELQPERDASRHPLFQVMAVLQRPPLPPLETPALTWRPLEVETQTAKFDLSLDMAETARGLSLTLEYSADLFEPDTAARMLGHLRTLLDSIALEPAQRIAELSLLTEAERRVLLEEWNDTGRPYPQGECLHELFEAQAGRTPGAIALIFGERRITYGELNARANRTAHFLRSSGVGPEAVVGLYLERSPEMLASILGVLKAGGAYLPIDQSYPQERIRGMIEDAEIRVLLTQSSLRDRLPPACGASVVSIDAEPEVLAAASGGNPTPSAWPDNLAYVIYTSGSTGRPKGVAISHRSAVAMLHWAQETYDAEQLRGVLASTSISFDLSVFEMFLPLSVGGRVVLVQNVLELPRLPAAGEVTLVNTVPSAMAELIRVGGVPASARTVNLAGEALKGELVDRIYEQTAATQVWNLYGPTEDTTYSTYSLVAPAAPVSIGRPIACTQVYLLDGHGRPVPVGVAGELYLGGAGLARGYMKRPALTAERFVPDPFGGRAGARLYRTGDLARYRSDGAIEYLGRGDQQVKIRGFRIEMGEIEAALGRHPSVREAVVVAREADGGDKQLVAYLTAGGERAPTVEELRALLKGSLPDYMVPSAFVYLDAVPLTRNGKVDRKALPAPERTRPDLADAFVAPRTVIEEMVASTWSQVLRLENIGVHDNFFALGGHSLLATQVVTRLRETFQIELPVRSLFESPTVAEMASLIVREQIGEADDEALAQALAQLGELTAEDVEGLLASGDTSKGEDRLR